MGKNKEERKPVVGYEGLYEVSDWGNIKSLNYNKRGIEKKLILRETNKGHLCVRLYNKGNKKQFLVHRLKAIAFIPNPDNKQIVNHRDSDRKNNGYNIDGRDNCERCTQSENIKHAVKLGRIIPPNMFVRGGKHPCSKKVNQYNLEGVLIKGWECIKDIQRELGFSSTAIIGCCKGRTKTSAGFIRKYTNVKEGK